MPRVYKQKLILTGNKIEIISNKHGILVGGSSRNSGGRSGRSDWEDETRDHIKTKIENKLEQQERDLSELKKERWINKALSIALTQKNRRNKFTVASRRRSNLIRKINSNTDLNKFLTLSFKDNITDLTLSHKYFDDFYKRLKRFIKKFYFKEDFKCIGVTEFQEENRDGVVHYHLLLNTNYIPHNILTALWKNDKYLNKLQREKQTPNQMNEAYETLKLQYKQKGLNYWNEVDSPAGYIWINKIDDIDNLGLYLSKYLYKSLLDDRFDNRKPLILRGPLEKPYETTDPEDIGKILNKYQKYLINDNGEYRQDYLMRDNTYQSKHDDNEFRSISFNMNEKFKERKKNNFKNVKVNKERIDKD